MPRRAGTTTLPSVYSFTTSAIETIGAIRRSSGRVLRSLDYPERPEDAANSPRPNADSFERTVKQWPGARGPAPLRDVFCVVGFCVAGFFILGDRLRVVGRPGVLVHL